MPVEPPATPWLFPEPRQLEEQADGDLVAIGADLAPGTLLAAYRHGMFPMPIDGPIDGHIDGPAGGRAGGPVHWWSPDPRAVLPLTGLRMSRSLRRACRDFEIRVDSAFEDVVAGCADPARPQGWIDPAIAAAYGELHRLGWAHSVEAWRDGTLVGGLYGVGIGGLFAGESMFHRARDASKVALVGLVSLLRDEHAASRVLDVQWRTDHLASLGVVTVRRRDYLARLPDVLAVPDPVWR